MPGQNSRGVPYPLDSDPIADWPSIMVSLASELAALLPQAGVLSVDGFGGDADWHTIGHVDFPVAYTVAPTVHILMGTAYSGAPTPMIQPFNITAAGCDVRGKCADDKGPSSVRWIAVPTTVAP